MQDLKDLQVVPVQLDIQVVLAQDTQAVKVLVDTQVVPVRLAPMVQVVPVVTQAVLAQMVHLDLQVVLV
jgi:hypothetical protein